MIWVNNSNTIREAPDKAIRQLAEDYFIMADNVDGLAKRLGEVNEMTHYMYPQESRELVRLMGKMRHDANCLRNEGRRLNGAMNHALSSCTEAELIGS